MGLINYYMDKYLNKIKAKYGDKIYIEAHFSGYCKIISEVDGKVLFECKTFKELMDSID